MGKYSNTLMFYNFFLKDNTNRKVICRIHLVSEILYIFLFLMSWITYIITPWMLIQKHKIAFRFHPSLDYASKIR